MTRAQLRRHLIPTALLLTSLNLIACEDDPDPASPDARPADARPADAPVDAPAEAGSSPDVADAATADLPATASGRPNILLIVADDLGYSDIGAFGGEISTPNLDTLAAEGRLLTGHRSGSLCSPTRAMITSGTDSHLAGVGRQGGGTGPQLGKPGYEGYLNDRALSIAELLRDAGYHTYLAGKWHLGDSEDRSPKARGYESSFVLLPGGGHVLQRVRRPAHRRPAAAVPGERRPHRPAQGLLRHRLLHRQADRLHRGQPQDGKPFFAFAAYTAPHWPLQAPAAFIDRYRGRYDAGYEAVRAKRIERQKALGIIPEAFQPNPLLPGTADNAKTWAALSDAEKQDQARRMEIYAAMVENLDANIGRLIRYLKTTGQYDNTFIFFQSDNGAEGGDRDGFGDASRSGAVDNSLANLGRKGSYVGYGPRWAEVGATPFRLWKSYATEGGVAVPAIARLPRQHQARVRFDAVTHIVDLAPTFLELAGAAQPGNSYKGKPVAPHHRACRCCPRWRIARPACAAPTRVLAWEHGNHRFVLRDNWKLVWVADRFGPTPRTWQLYDLAADRAEVHDLAGSRPEIAQQLTAAWDRYAADNGVVLLPPPAPPDAGADAGGGSGRRVQAAVAR